MPKLIALLLLATAGLSIGTLVSGSGYSERALPGGLPFGNVLAATTLCSLAGAAFALSPPGSIRRRVSRMTLLVAALWLPISVALAGNLALNFSGYRGTVWLAMTSVTTIAVLICLAWAVAGLLLGFRRRSSAA